MTPEALDLLSWVAREPRTYPDAIEVWRTNCPQHPCGKTPSTRG